MTDDIQESADLCACGCERPRVGRSTYATPACRQRVYNRAVQMAMPPSEYGTGHRRTEFPGLVDRYERRRLARALRQTGPIDRLLRELSMEAP